MLENLLNYAIKHGLIMERDRNFCRNQIAALLKIKNPELLPFAYPSDNVDELLAPLLELAVQNGVLTSTHPDYADLMDTAIMGCLCPMPHFIQDRFNADYKISPKLAMDNFYQFSIASNYVRINRIKKNIAWSAMTDCGELDITVNLSKPEKDPIAIALAKNEISSDYPQCLLCKENEGYAGTLTRPARQNLRLISMELEGEEWFFQFSPYVYFNQHSVLLSKEHRPMKISADTFKRIFAFLEKFPHYFIGSNADLPIVGGSILFHDHFQAGEHEFPLDKTESFYQFQKDNLEVQLLNWPVSVVRFLSEDPQVLTNSAVKLLDYWREYSNPKLDILAHTGTEPHNTITPIGRKKGNIFQLDLALRNNRTDEKHPLGIFHPHLERHHIKKENIGLIEVLGLAILPGRLLEELKHIKKYLVEKSIKSAEKDLLMQKHIPWMKDLAKKYTFTKENIENILHTEVAYIFYDVLKDCGVFKKNEDFKNFINDFAKFL